MPTTNPVPSTDPSDLLFNAGKLDEVVNGTANSFTDRLGVARRTVAGMNADFDAQLADAESDLNVYRADAAASAAEALGYLQTIRATSYGAYANDPATDPLGNPPTVGDEYFNTTANLLKRWNGTTWQASDINTANLAAPSGSSLVGYMPAGTGAVATTVQKKLRENVSVTDYGAIADEGVTDNTAVIAALFASLGSSYSGVIKIPYGVKYDFNTIATLAPVRAIINDESAINGWNSSGWRQKIIGPWEAGDPTAVNDLNYTISSGHHPSITLDNRMTAGSDSANECRASIMWTSGRFKKDTFQHLRPMARLQFIKSQYRPTLWHYALRKYATFAARAYEFWGAGKTFNTGEYVINAGKTYVAASSGTCGSTAPTHLSGTVSDGGVSWTFVEFENDSYLFGVDEKGRISTNASTVGWTYRFKQSDSDSEQMIAGFQATGTSKEARLYLDGTDSSGVQAQTPYLVSNTSGALQMWNRTSSIRLFSASSDRFEIGPLARREIVATDGDTSPSVSQAGALVLANTAATSITTLDDGASNHEIMLIFENSNTTLVHSASLVLKGGVNVTPGTKNIIVLKKYTRSTSWIEVSRNF